MIPLLYGVELLFLSLDTLLDSANDWVSRFPASELVNRLRRRRPCCIYGASGILGLVEVKDEFRQIGATQNRTD